MTTAYTSLLGLALPVTGELSGTWGDTVNNSITSLLDSAIAGTTTLSADTTLTTTTGASNQARQAILLCTGHVANITITAPAQSKIYTVINASATYTVKIRGVGPTTGITIPVSSTATVAWNGSDFVDASGYINGNLKVNGTLSVTGAVTLTAGTASTTTGTGTLVITGGLGVSGRINAANFDGIIGANTAAAGSFTTLSATGTITSTSGNSTTVFTAASATTGYLLASLINGGGSTYIATTANTGGLGIIGGGAYASTFGSTTNTNIELITNNTVRQIINGDGNVGIGVTPSAWTAGRTAIQISGSSTAVYFAGATTNTIFSNNNYYNAGDKFTTASGYAQQYQQQSNGVHAWFTSTAASGGAGATATFTQAMTLDASGNLMVGATTAYGKLHVLGSTGAILESYASGRSAPGDGLMIVDGGYGSTAGVASLSLSGGLGNNSTMSGWVISSQNTGGAGGPAPYLAFSALTPTSGGGNTQTAIGTEYARFTSGGRLWVGAGATDYPFSVKLASDSGNYLCKLENTAATPYGLYLHYSNTAPNNGVNEFMYAADNSAVRFYVKSNGGIGNYAGNNTILSDRREKTNFAPAKSYLDVICAIPVQTFNYIDQNMEEDGGLTLGVVAQDVQTVAPELVSESNWANRDEEPKMRLEIYQTDLQFALMKCIQELKAEIDSLKSQLNGA